MSHVNLEKHHFSKGSVHFSDEDMEFMHKLVSAPFEKDEEPAEDDAVEEMEPEDEPRTRRRRNEGVTREELLPILDAIVGLVGTLKNQPAPVVHVAVNPEVKLAPGTTRKTVSRDKSGKIESVIEEHLG